MRPFVLNQHKSHFSSIRQLRDEEIAAVGGAGGGDGDNTTSKSSTYTVTINSDGGDDGIDQG